MVTPDSFLSFSNKSRISALNSGSRAPVGSSARSRVGLLTIARALATARAAGNGDPFAMLDSKVHAGEDILPRLAFVDFGESLNFDRIHSSSFSRCQDLSIR